MTFEITDPSNLTLVHSQSRTEIHGEDKVTALDARWRWMTSNHALDMIAPGLRKALMGKGQPEAKPGDPQQSLNLNVDELGRLNFPGLKYPLKWDNEHQGPTMTVENGVNGKIKLTQCKVHRFESTPLPGGSCIIEFTTSSSHEIDEHKIGVLGMRHGTDFGGCTLAAPKLKGDAQGDIDTPEKALARGRK